MLFRKFGFRHRKIDISILTRQFYSFNELKRGRGGEEKRYIRILEYDGTLLDALVRSTICQYMSIYIYLNDIWKINKIFGSSIYCRSYTRTTLSGFSIEIHADSRGSHSTTSIIFIRDDRPDRE
jgi:hypothetical protein